MGSGHGTQLSDLVAESFTVLKRLPKKLNTPTNVSEVLILGTHPKGMKSFLYKDLYTSAHGDFFCNSPKPENNTPTNMSLSGECILSYTGTMDYYRL